MPDELDRSELMAILQAEARDTMHAVLGMLHVISEGLLTSDQRHRVRSCRVRADKFLRRFDDIRRLLDSGDDPPLRAPFELAQAVEEVIGLMHVLALRKGVALEVSVSPGLPPAVISDRSRLEEILSRLLAGGIRRPRVGRVLFHAEAESSVPAGRWTVRFRVTSQVPEPAPDTAQEDGVGRAILRELVADLGGAMTCEPSLPEGIGVSVVLPLEAPAAARLGSFRSILMAESSEASPLEGYLEGQPYRVFRAWNGAQAVELARRNSYDAVVMELQMPDLDGFSATRAIREWETRSGRPRMPIIVFSAAHEESEVREGGTAGCSAYLAKPFGKGALLAVLREYAPV